MTKASEKPMGASQDIPSTDPVTVIYENGVEVTFGAPEPGMVSVLYRSALEPRVFASKAAWHQFEEDCRHHTDDDYRRAGQPIPDRWWLSSGGR